jgi:hypothetical protein
MVPPRELLAELLAPGRAPLERLRVGEERLLEGVRAPGGLGSYPSSLSAFSQPASPRASSPKSLGCATAADVPNSLARPTDRNSPVSASTLTS